MKNNIPGRKERIITASLFSFLGVLDIQINNLEKAKELKEIKKNIKEMKKIINLGEKALSQNIKQIFNNVKIEITKGSLLYKCLKGFYHVYELDKDKELPKELIKIVKDKNK